MSLKFTILGFLANSPRTGYDLQKKIETAISHFWPSTQSQIYRSLKEMSGESLITAEVQYQKDRPNRKVYSITPKGREELLQWLSTPLDLPRHRNQFLAQLFFSGNIDKETVIRNLEHYRDEMTRRLGFLQGEEVRKMVGMTDRNPERVLFGIIRDNGLMVLGAEIQWAEASITRLEEERNG